VTGDNVTVTLSETPLTQWDWAGPLLDDRRLGLTGHSSKRRHSMTRRKRSTAEAGCRANPKSRAAARQSKPLS
jgi:hypothetical protein